MTYYNDYIKTVYRQNTVDGHIVATGGARGYEHLFYTTIDGIKVAEHWGLRDALRGHELIFKAAGRTTPTRPAERMTTNAR